MYWPIAFCTRSSATTMSTRSPSVPDSSTSCAARARGRAPTRAPRRRASTGSRARSRGSPAAAPGRSGSRAAAPPKILHDLVAVDREVDGLSRLELVEGLDVDVEREVPVGRQLVDVHLRREAAEQLPQAVGGQVVDDPVGLSPLDLRDLGLDAQAEALHDRVDVAVGLRRRRPDLEVRVALQHELPGRRVRGPVRRGPCPTSRETSVPISSAPTLGGSSAAGGSASFCSHSGSGRVRWNVIVRPAHRDAALERAGRGILQTRRRRRRSRRRATRRSGRAP